MSEIRISIQVEDKKNTMHLKDVSEETLKQITKNFFLAAGLPIEINLAPKDATPSPYKADEKLEVVSETVESDGSYERVERTIRPRRLPLTGGAKTLSTPIGDIIGEKTKEPDFYRTGIKEIEGVKHYKTRFTCSDHDCNRKGNHYVPKDTPWVPCWECDRKLLVEDAAYNGFPERDDYGNFYIAVKTYEEA